MKLNKMVPPLALALIVALAASTGCTHKYNAKVTNIPQQSHGPATTGGNEPPPGIPNTPPLEPPPETPFSKPVVPPDDRGSHPTADIDLRNFTQDRQTLAADTVYFKYDSTVVEDSERANVSNVAQALADPALKLLIEGHCDERGTEEYNRALGERRALALREALAADQIDPMRIKTISFGKDQPAEPGHDEAAWAKNRRGVFVLLHPKTPVP